ncbi:hypothetical protein C8Q74DRAFT_1213078 [Fomes fomentarius]|nr:hypothetical protein C8Q74DRAFT_1213078 [Fomes fomentarius]
MCPITISNTSPTAANSPQDLPADQQGREQPASDGQPKVASDSDNPNNPDYNPQADADANSNTNTEATDTEEQEAMVASKYVLPTASECQHTAQVVNIVGHGGSTAKVTQPPSDLVVYLSSIANLLKELVWLKCKELGLRATPPEQPVVGPSTTHQSGAASPHSSRSCLALDDSTGSHILSSPPISPLPTFVTLQCSSMSEGVCYALGLTYDPWVHLEMQSANGNINSSLGPTRKVPVCFGLIFIYPQFHVICSPAYNVVLGCPSDIVMSSVICTNLDGS